MRSRGSTRKGGRNTPHIPCESTNEPNILAISDRIKKLQSRLNELVVVEREKSEEKVSEITSYPSYEPW
jgi:hypothetical protein